MMSANNGLTPEQEQLLGEFEADIAATMDGGGNNSNMRDNSQITPGLTVGATNLGGTAPQQMQEGMYPDPWQGQQLPQRNDVRPQVNERAVGGWNNFQRGNIANTRDHRDANRRSNVVSPGHFGQPAFDAQ